MPHYTEPQLQAIYDSIATPTQPVAPKRSAFDGARLKFRKVYKAPGYPVDPRLVAARALDAWVNFSPQSGAHQVFDWEGFRRWLSDTTN